MTRRRFLMESANGFGAVATAALFGGRAHAGDSASPLAPRAPHFQARARSVIFLYMDGGPSQVDTFDPKPRLEAENGKPIGIEVPKTQFDNVRGVLDSPWKFNQYGESGLWVSDLFPHVARQADKLCVIRSMTSKFPEHTAANYFLHTGHGVGFRNRSRGMIEYLRQVNLGATPGEAALAAFGESIEELEKDFLRYLRKGEAPDICRVLAGDSVDERTGRRDRLDDAERARLGIDPLPQTLGEALAALEADEVLLGALGEARARAYLAVKRHEWGELEGATLDDEVALLAERY